VPISSNRIGPYEIVAPIGSGGMGEVYRARDSKLGRDVAVKILSEALTSDADYIARFEREAQVLAALNHPNIASIYGLEDGAIVMELVEGATLADRIAEGPIPPAEALGIAKQIAGALDAAHEKGIIHRDLKPANIKVTPEGVVKVLDFGLATAAQVSPTASANPAASPTLTIRATQAGVIMGTAAYMSPEQAAGKPVDRRADIWSFGVVLYEMLTGRRLYDGETLSHTLAHVLTMEPDWTMLPKSTPAGARRLLQHCLIKDPKKRLRDIGDAWTIMDETEERGPAAQPPPARRSRYERIAWAIACLALLIALGIVARRHFSEQSSVARLSLLAPEKTSFVSRSHPTLSPDGRKLTFIVASETGTQLWLRDMDSLVARPLPGSSDANDPFWSPDSRFIGFFSQGKLKKVEVAGGPAQTICDAPQGRGGTWNQNGVIVFTPAGTEPLYRVAAAGGKPARVTELDPSHNERSHRFPWFLPDGRHFVYLARTRASEENAIYVGDLESKERKQIVAVDSSAIYVPQGFLLFVRERTLFAQPFDTGRIRTTGDPFPIAEQVDLDANNSKGDFSASLNGVLVYFSRGAGTAPLTWYDREGRPFGTLATRGGSSHGVAVSPDGATVAVDEADPSSGKFDIWLHVLARNTTTRFTFDPGQNINPVWSPDGGQLAFVSRRKGQWLIVRKSADGSGSEEILLTSPNSVVTHDWSRDGHYLVFGRMVDTIDLWVLPLSGDRKPFPYLATPFNEFAGKLSPDVRWMAYTSDESGRNEVYVQSFPTPRSKIQISTTGGSRPLWSRDGKELFYLALDRRLMAVEMKTGPKFEAASPKSLFPTGVSMALQNFDISPDGRRFLVPSPPAAETGAVPLTVVLNWPAALRK